MLAQHFGSSVLSRTQRMLRSIVLSVPLLAPADGCDCGSGSPSVPPPPTASWVTRGPESIRLLDGTFPLSVRTAACASPHLSLNVSGDANGSFELVGSSSGDVSIFDSSGYQLLNIGERCALTGSFVLSAVIRCADNSARPVGGTKTISVEANARVLPVRNEVLFFRRIQAAVSHDFLVFSNDTRVHAVAQNDGRELWSAPLASAATLWPHMHTTSTHHHFVTTGPSTVHAEASSEAAESVTLQVPGTIIDIAAVGEEFWVLSRDGERGRLIRWTDGTVPALVAESELPAGEPVLFARTPSGRTSTMIGLRQAGDGNVHFFAGPNSGWPMNAEVPVPYPTVPCPGGNTGTSGTVGGSSSIPMSNGDSAGTATTVLSGCNIKIGAFPPFNPFRMSGPNVTPPSSRDFALLLNDENLELDFPAEWDRFEIVDAFAMEGAVTLVTRVGEERWAAMVVDAHAETAKIVPLGQVCRYDGGASSPNAARVVLSMDRKLFVIGRDAQVKATVGVLPSACQGLPPLPATFADNQTLLVRTMRETFLLGQ